MLEYRDILPSIHKIGKGSLAESPRIGNYTQSELIINTFVTQTYPNVNAAMQYYEQKARNFLITLLGNVARKTTTAAQSYSIESMFNALPDDTITGPSTWWHIYNSTQIDNTIDKFNELTEEIDGNLIPVLDFLKKLELNNRFPADSTYPGVIDVNSTMQKYLYRINNGLSKGTTERNNVLGDIYEQIGGGLIANNFNKLINQFGSSKKLFSQQVGRAHSIMPNRFGTQSSLTGKMDYLFCTLDKAELIKTTQSRMTASGLKSSKNVTMIHYNNGGTGALVQLEADQVIDLANGGLTQAFSNYTMGASAGVLGASMKASLVEKGTSLGSFGYGIREMANYPGTIRERELLNHITHREDFYRYNAQVTSRFLLNIIGANNGIMVTGSSGYQWTYMWLFNLYNSGKELRYATQDFSDDEEHRFTFIAKNPVGVYAAPNT